MDRYHEIKGYVMAQWLVQHLRVTLFTDAGTPDEGGSSLFAELAGAECDSDEKRGNGSMRRRAGVVGDQRIELQQFPGRVDFAILGAVDLQIAALQGNLAAASIGSLPALHMIDAAALLLMKRYEGVTRAALATLVFEECAGPEEAYRMLGTLIPRLDLDPSHTADFMLQINRFKLSASIQGLRLNRLATWNASQALLPGMTPRPLPYVHWVQAALEVNTDGTNITPIESEKLPVIWEEMKSELIALSEGDR